MRKIDYSKIKWDANTNWEFCGSKENLREVFNRYNSAVFGRGFGPSTEEFEFGYKYPNQGLAFDKGDIVTFHGDNVTALAVVVTPVTSAGYFEVRFADGSTSLIHPCELNEKVEISDIPDELMALARAEAGKPLDLSKCPLKNAGACMKRA